MTDPLQSTPSNGPATTFTGRTASVYEQAMGRWSRLLAPLLIRFGGVVADDRVLDVGCGTGSLTFTLPEVADVASVTGIDQSDNYIEYARAQNKDGRIDFRTADARVLPFDKASFDRAFSLLVLQFVPEVMRAVAEMRRVVRPGGTVAAAVWDGYGGLNSTRVVSDIATALDPAYQPNLFRPLSAPGELAEAWRAAGFVDVEQISLTIRMDYSCFDDYWLPMSAEGPVAQIITSLTAPRRAALAEAVRRAYLANRPDGARSFAATAWACRGTVP